MNRKFLKSLLLVTLIAALCCVFCAAASADIQADDFTHTIDSVTGAHTYGEWINDTVAIPNKHTRVCTECGYTETANGACGQSVYWIYHESNNTLVLSGNGPMYDYVSSVNSPAFAPWERLNVTMPVYNLVIEDGVTYIGANTFDECRSRMNVTMADSVTRIGRNAFHTTKLDNVKLSEGLKVVDEYAFAYSELNAALPETLKTIGKYAFSYCNIEAVTISGLATIEEGAFIGCEKLEKVTVDNTLTAIYKENVFPSAVTIAAACYESVNGDYMSAYSYMKANNVSFEATAHFFSDWKADAATRTCICGYSEANHTHGYTISAIAPNCTTLGTTWCNCECGKSFIIGYTDTFAHEYESKVTLAPTYKTEGIETFTCKCGHTYTQAIPVLPDEPCQHMCHHSGFLGFIWNIVVMFLQMFGASPECYCGAAHY